MRRIIYEAIFEVMILIIGIFAGFFIHAVYVDYKKERILNGMLIRGVESDKALKTAIKYEEGDWVMVNIKGMEYQTAIETCKHEVAHEMFAEYCESRIDECINLTEKHGHNN